MHETAVTKLIFETVLQFAQKHEAERVLNVRLEIGAFSDLSDGWMQKFFDLFAKGSVAEGARLSVSRKPAMLACGSCKRQYPVEIPHFQDARCPYCGGDTARLLRGREYVVTAIDIV